MPALEITLNILRDNFIHFRYKYEEGGVLVSEGLGSEQRLLQDGTMVQMPGLEPQYVGTHPIQKAVSLLFYLLIIIIESTLVPM